MLVLKGTTARLQPEEEVLIPRTLSDTPDVQRAIARAEQTILDSGALVDMPLMHVFTPGLYARTIFMPAGTILTSKIHKTEHPFVVTQGSVSVFVPGEGVEHIVAPYMGVTKAGTQRVLYIHEDTTWTTFHVNPADELDLEVIEDRIIDQPLLEDGRETFLEYRGGLSNLLIENGEPEVEPQYEYGGAP